MSILKDKKLYLFLLITLLFFGIFFRMEYATDTYSVFMLSDEININHFMKCGRLVTAAWWGIMSLFNFSENIIYILSAIIAILAMTISQYKLFNIIKRDIKSTTIAVLIPILIILNIFSIELFLFIEKGILVLSVLFSILAFENLIKYFEGNKKNILFAIIFMLLATFSYQGTVALFIALSIVYILKYSKNFKEFIKYNFLTALCYGIPAILNFVMVKFIFDNARTTGSIDIIRSINKVASGTWNMLINTSRIMPKYIFITLVLLVILLILYKIFTKKVQTKDELLNVLKLLYIIAGTVIVTVLPYIMQSTNSIWIVPRSAFTIASLAGILLLFLFINFDINIIQEKIILVIGIIFLLIQFARFQDISIDRYILNYMDKEVSMQIKELMIDYEKETGTNIENIAIYYDKNSSYTYNGLFVSGDINTKGYVPDWCVDKVLQYYVKPELNVVNKDSEIEAYFKEYDWNYFNKEQVIFKDNTMHICVF